MSIWIGHSTNKLEYAGHRLLSPATITTTLADTFYPLGGTYAVLNTPGFSVDEDGVITYTGTGGTFLVIGTVNLITDRYCTIKYGTRVNGVIAGYTACAITMAAPIGYINSNVIFDLHAGDIVEFWGASTIAGTVLETQLAKVSIFGLPH